MFRSKVAKTVALVMLLGAPPLLTASQPNTISAEEQMFPTLARYRVSGLTKTTMDQVALRFEVIARVNDTTFEVLVPHRDRKAFLNLAPAATLIRDDEAAADSIEIFGSSDGTLAGYRNYESVVAEVQKLAQGNLQSSSMTVASGNDVPHTPRQREKASQSKT